MTRRLLDVLTAGLLMLFVAACVLWVRSWIRGDVLERVTREISDDGATAANVTWAVGVSGGRLFAGMDRVSGPVAEFGAAPKSGYREFPPAPVGLAPTPTMRGVRLGPVEWGRDRYAVGAVAYDRGAVVTSLWALAALAAVLPTLRAFAVARAALRRHRRRARSLAGLCPACAYDLRATPGQCPECGAASSVSTPA
jgi:hypothetical protein